MAQLLIMATDNENDDPEKDRQCYKRGDIVTVHPDDHIFGRLECPPKFQIVVVPDEPIESFSQYLETGEYRRLFSFNLEGVFAQSLRALSIEEESTPAEIVITKEEFDSLIVDKRGA